MLKVIVFDWDGTIANSIGEIWRCKKFLAEKHGYPVPSEEMVRSVLGKEFKAALSACFPLTPTLKLSIIGQEFHELMKENKYQACLFPNAEEVLNQLKEAGFKLAIATSKNPEEMNIALEHHSLNDAFDVVCCGAQFEPKPNPRMLEYIMDIFSVKPEECLIVGDTIFDIQFGQNAKVPAIAVTFGAHSTEKLKSLNPLVLIKNWVKLHDFIITYAAKEASCCQKQ